MAAENYTLPGSSPSPVSRSSNGTPLFECVCPGCGKVRIQDRRKIGKPCATCAAAMRRTHGMSGSPLYKVWAGMIARCTYPSASGYAYYGGRGISVCSEWRTPAVFFAWAKENGYRKGVEIDRIDAKGDYCPENCRFLSHQENSQLCRHVKCTRELAAKVKRDLAAGLSVKDASKNSGVPYMSVWHISKGHTWKNA